MTECSAVNRPELSFVQLPALREFPEGLAEVVALATLRWLTRGERACALACHALVVLVLNASL